MEYFSMLKIQGLEQNEEHWSYKEIEIVDIHNQMNDLVRQSFFILKKSDLPSIMYNDMTQKDVDKFVLQKIDEQRCIYANILDLNKSENRAIADEIPTNSMDNPSKCVLVCVGINTEIRYKLNTNSIQLKIFDQFDDRGTVNILSDVQSI